MDRHAFCDKPVHERSPLLRAELRGYYVKRNSLPASALWQASPSALLRPREDLTSNREITPDTRATTSFKSGKSSKGPHHHNREKRSNGIQTVFNSLNVMVGIGLFAIPFGFKLCGWIPGLVFFILVAISTGYTAQLLGECLAEIDHLHTFSDIALVSMGAIAQMVTSLLFGLELVAASVALIVLFSDSLEKLIPGYTSFFWKVICGITIFALSFLPLRILSYTSFFGVVASVTTVALISIDGLIKTEAPGSIRATVPVPMFFESWTDLAMGFGILISPWSGHSVFPSIYRDMRRTQDFNANVRLSYVLAFVLEIALATEGLLMFGNLIEDEITTNVFDTPEFSPLITLAIMACVAIISLSKVPLFTRPVIADIETFLKKIQGMTIGPCEQSEGQHTVRRIAARLICTATLLVLAYCIPSFGHITALLGSVACFLICIIMPCAFHLRLKGQKISVLRFSLDWLLIAIFGGLALWSTTCTLLSW